MYICYPVEGDGFFYHETYHWKTFQFFFYWMVRKAVSTRSLTLRARGQIPVDAPGHSGPRREKVDQVFAPLAVSVTCKILSFTYKLILDIFNYYLMPEMSGYD